MSSYSPNLAIELIDNGAQSGQWGNTTNTNLGTLIEQAISGYVEYACTGGTDTITIPNGATGVARNMYIELTGTGGGTLIVPANKKLYFIYNNTTSGAVTVKVTGQTGISVSNGNRMVLACDGTDVVPAVTFIPFTNVDVTDLAVTNLTIGGFKVTASSGNLVFSSSLTYTASISSTIMTVSAATAGNVMYGQEISGTGVTAGTTVAEQLTSSVSVTTKTYVSGGAIGDVSFEISGSSSVTAGQMVSGLGIPAGTYVGWISDNVVYLIDRTGAAVAFTIQASGTYTFSTPGGAGTYTVSASQSVSSTTITAVTSVAQLTPYGAFGAGPSI